MNVRRATAGVLVAFALAFALAACGGSGAAAVPDVAKLPLLPGVRVATRFTDCNPGASAYCAVQLVVVDRRYPNSDDLLLAERRFLHARGWTGANGDTGTESAADSPGHKLHLIYATADGDLLGLEFKWVHRAGRIWTALSNSIFDGEPALSLVLELGSGAS